VRSSSFAAAENPAQPDRTTEKKLNQATTMSTTTMVIAKLSKLNIGSRPVMLAQATERLHLQRVDSARTRGDGRSELIRTTLVLTLR
jgi:hypothetical protein